MISRIGKYTVEKELGFGGFGRVYLAFDPDVKRKVAIKCIEHIDPDKLKYFLREIPTTGRLGHKNIVTIYDSGEDAGKPYLVMELLEGKTLKDVIQERLPLSILDKARIMMQVAEGLAYAHSKGVVHRDVKPENIMLLPDKSVKIMDFGIALAPDRGTGMTQTGGLIGTARYFAPEQIEGTKANEQSDIFSFGDVYYELLTGVHPFQRFVGDWLALQGAILTHDPQPVSQLAPDCPEALELLVQRTLAKHLQFRYKSFAELVLDSEAIIVDLQHDVAVEILEEARKIVDGGNLQAARSKVRDAQRLDPGNREARRLLESIDQQMEKELQRARVAQLLAQAEGRMAERRFLEAVQLLEAAERLDSTSAAVVSRLGEARSKLDAAARANRLVEEARERQQKGEFAEALDRLNAALAIDPDHTEAKRLTPRLAEQIQKRLSEQRCNEVLQAASAHVAARRFVEAQTILEQWEKDQPGAPGIAPLRAQLDNAKAAEERRIRVERFQLALARTNEAIDAGDLDRARTMLAHLEANFAAEGAGGALSAVRGRLEPLRRPVEIPAVTPSSPREEPPPRIPRPALLTLGIVALVVLLVGGFYFRLYLQGQELAQLIQSGQLTDLNEIWNQWTSIGESDPTSWLLSEPRRVVKAIYVEAGDRAIMSYRRGETVYEATWKYARDQFQRALSVEPGDIVRGKLRLAEGHLARINGLAAHQPADLNLAMEKFADARQLMARSDPDAWLGIAQMHFVLKDVDSANAAIQAAIKRGYSLGNRERVQLADGYRQRADRLVWDSRSVRGLPLGADQVQRAHDDYRRALELYQAAAPYGNSNARIVQVQSSLEAINTPPPANNKPPPEGFNKRLQQLFAPPKGRK